MTNPNSISSFYFKESAFELLESGEFPLRAPEDRGNNILVGVYPRNFGTAVLNLRVITDAITIKRQDERPLQVLVQSPMREEFTQVFDEPIESLTLERNSDGAWATAGSDDIKGDLSSYVHFIDTLSAYAPHAQTRHARRQP